MSPYTREYLTAYALDAARKDEWLAVKKAIIHLERDHGPEGLEWALRAWIDTACATMPPADGPVRWVWFDVGSGELNANTQDLEPAQRWAAQMFGARQASDLDTWNALLDALPDDRKEIGDHVVSVLQAAALTMARNEASR